MEVGNPKRFQGVAATAFVKHLNTRRQFLECERFDEIIIGAGLEAFELVLERVPGGQHQHRCSDAGVLAQATAHVEAVDARQAKIENDDVVVVGYSEV